MNKILKERVIFIRSMLRTVSNIHPDFRPSLNKLIREIRKDEKKHFLSVSQDAAMQVSYARRPEDKLDSTRRIRVAFGKYIMRNLSPENLADDIINCFVAKTWAYFSASKATVQLLYGEDIVKAYSAMGQTEAHSCMTGNACEFTRFYALNPDKVCMAVLGDVRALLWTTDDGTKVLDRAYPSSYQRIAILREWAKRKGYVIRVNPDKLVTDSVVQLSDDNVYNVTMKCADEFPYLDTFCFGSFVGSRRTKVVLSNSKRGMDCVFHDTSGSFESEEDYFTCEFCEDRISDDDRCNFNGTIICDECYNDRIRACHECDDSIDIEDGESVNHNCRWYCSSCFHDLFFTCNRCDEVTSVEDAVHCITNGGEYCPSCAESYLSQCESCHEYIVSRLAVQIGEGLYCKGCSSLCDCGRHKLSADDLCQGCEAEEQAVVTIVASDCADRAPASP